jgi:hypothetical protein
MRIGHLKEELTGPPRRYVFGIWDSAVRDFVEGTEWVVVEAGNSQMTVERLRGTFGYFSVKQCEGVSIDVQQILARFNLRLSRQWKVYRIARPQ